MWRYSIANLYFIVLLQIRYSCVCTEQNEHRKGETGSVTDYKEKRQLGSEEYTTPETDAFYLPHQNGHQQNILREAFLVNNLANNEISYDESTSNDSNTEDYILTSTTTDYTSTDTTEATEATITNYNSTDVYAEAKSIPELSLMSEFNSPPGLGDSSEINYLYETSEVSDTFVSAEKRPMLDINYSNIFSNEMSEVRSFGYNNISKLAKNPEHKIEKKTNNKTTPTITAGTSLDCHKFKKTGKLDINKMADIWKIRYYTLSQPLKCFKLHIKLLTTEDRVHYAIAYGNFNDRVQWDKIRLEILSDDRNRDGFTRKHFLQTGESVDSILKNIIIQEEIYANTTTALTLINEASDQWLVVMNLLLMRDCETGDIVVFSRISYNPKESDIQRALEQFNEPKKLVGTIVC